MGDRIPFAQFPHAEAFDLEREGALDDVVHDLAVGFEPVADALAGSDQIFLQRGDTGVDHAGVRRVRRLGYRHPARIGGARDVHDVGVGIGRQQGRR